MLSFYYWTTKRQGFFTKYVGYKIADTRICYDFQTQKIVVKVTVLKWVKEEKRKRNKQKLFNKIEIWKKTEPTLKSSDLVFQLKQQSLTTKENF